MNSFYFVIDFILGLLCFATTISSLTNVSFENGFAVFRQSGTFQFEVNKELDILFLEKHENPTLENSVYGIIVRHNRTKHSNTDAVHFVLYERGVEKISKSFDVEDLDLLKHFVLSIDAEGALAISVVQHKIRSIIFNYPEEVDFTRDPVNISYLAIKPANSTTSHDKDFFLWLSNTHLACPHKNAYFSCDLKINKPNLILKENRNNSSSSPQKIMYMKMLSDSFASTYELLVTVNQTGDNPRLYIMKNNHTKLKMDATFGNFELTVNMSADTFVIGRKNDSVPALLWRDLSENQTTGNFSALKYVVVQNTDPMSFMAQQRNSDTNFGNACRIFCNPIKELPWYTRWKNKFKGTFTNDN